MHRRVKVPALLCSEGNFGGSLEALKPGNLKVLDRPAAHPPGCTQRAEAPALPPKRCSGGSAGDESAATDHAALQGDEIPCAAPEQQNFVRFYCKLRFVIPYCF